MQYTPIGIVGGAGPMTSALLYQDIITYCQQTYHAHEDADFPEITIINYPFSPMITHTQNHQVKQELQNAVDKLKRTESHLIAFTCNTLHTYRDHINTYTMELVDIRDAINAKIHKQQCTTSLFLGTPASAIQHLYQTDKRTIVYPLPHKQQLITDIIYTILAGKETQSDAEQLAYIINDAQKTHPIDSVILGCTELPIIYRKYKGIFNMPILIFDTLAILAETLIEKARVIEKGP